jgi:DNA invertase Pin-like site-specific DNA recombinase
LAEFYSANLSSEVKKGMKQKVEMGGWTHRAPLGYVWRSRFLRAQTADIEINSRRVCRG